MSPSKEHLENHCKCFPSPARTKQILTAADADLKEKSFFPGLIQCMNDPAPSFELY